MWAVQKQKILTKRNFKNTFKIIFLNSSSPFKDWNLSKL
jgi:hypothetical protein